MVGIILKEAKLFENDSFILVHTTEGIKRYVVKSAKKFSAKIMRFSRPLTKVVFEEKKSRIIFNCVINDYYFIKQNPKTLKLVLEMTKFVKTFSSFTKNENVFFYHFDLCLALIEQKYNPLVVSVMFYLKATYLLGINPQFSKEERLEKESALILNKIYTYKKQKLTSFLKELTNTDVDYIFNYLKILYKEMLDYSL